MEMSEEIPLLSPSVPPRSRGYIQRLLNLAKKVKRRTEKHACSDKIKKCYKRHKVTRKHRRARILRVRRIARPGIKGRSPANTRPWPGIFLGDHDDAETLQKYDFTRIVHLDRKTVVLQPHREGIPGHTPQWAFCDAYDYSASNFLKDFESLCRMMFVENQLGKNVLIYCSHRPTREEYSRARTLILAYLVYTGARCLNCTRKVEGHKAFRGILRKHWEELRVWQALQTAKTEVDKIMIYQDWKDDKRLGRKWRGPENKSRVVCTAKKGQHCNVM